MTAAGVRARAHAVALIGGALALLAPLSAAATWGAHRAPGGDVTGMVLLTPVAGLLAALVPAAGAILAVAVLALLAALRTRALAHRPPLARGRAGITAAHLLPPLNLIGPVAVLAETGVRTRPGAWAWWAGCLLAPVAAVARLTALTAGERIRADLLLGCAALALAAAGAALARALGAVPPRRLPAGPPPAGPRPFWARGADPAARPRGRVVLEPPLDDGAGDLIIRGGEGR
ncbi:hypothetical protein [Corynebacterium sphenisci]|uniref:hypothetical protein n=1 Tax=Corynebacterium sphenisci TaxID=191493 RepID=UPI0026DF18F8|nr:hypothetical protein [Corynebacterium sphenisci]MDO5732058.1 hypothetical protein [Corynebacterium sphenisci]